VTISGDGLANLGLPTRGAWHANVDHANITWPGAITLGSGGAIVGVFSAGGTYTLEGPITGTGPLTFWTGGAHNTHTHRIVLAAASDYTGDTTIEATFAANAELQLSGGDNRLPTGTVLSLGASSDWDGLYAKLFLNGNNQELAGLTASGDGTKRIVNGSSTTATLTINNSAAHTYAGILGGPETDENNFNLDKAGGGTMILGGNNTYTGTTTVSGGTLLVNGALADGAVTVTGGSLGGIGVVNGPVTVQAGGTLSPGESIGTLSVNNTLTLAAGSTTFVEVNAQTLESDLVEGMLEVSYGGTLVVSNVAGTLAVGQIFLLFSAETASGNFSSITPAPGSGLAWEFDPANGTLEVVPGGVTPPTLQFVSTSTNTLVVSWEGSGFRLQAQTNSVNVGLSGNWADYPGGSSSPVIVPIDPANGSVFLRLTAP
jgi:autotransporter-associated beta strand protein